MNLNDLAKMTIPQLQKFVYKILNDKGHGHLDADDIIHTAYILLWEKGLEFNFINMKKPIYEAITMYVYNKSPAITSKLMNETEKYCKRCTELKGVQVIYPIDMFYKIKVYPNGLIAYQPNCKECYNILNNKRKALRLENLETKIIHLKRRRELYKLKLSLT